MNLAAIKQAVASVVSSPGTAATNSTTVIGLTAAKVAASINEWLQTAILLGTAITIFVKVVLLLRKRHIRRRHRKTKV